jgi:hypothetical protein
LTGFACIISKVLSYTKLKLILYYHINKIFFLPEALTSSATLANFSLAKISNENYQ